MGVHITQVEEMGGDAAFPTLQITVSFDDASNFHHMPDHLQGICWRYEGEQELTVGPLVAMFAWLLRRLRFLLLLLLLPLRGLWMLLRLPLLQ